MDASDIEKNKLAAQSMERQALETSDSGRQRLRLLIVEDCDEFRESMRLYFCYFGYIVGVADCYDAAIEEAERNPPDVLICDWNINGQLDGTDVAREIHARFNPTIIFLSGASLARLRAASMDLEEAHYLQKPASPVEVAKIVKTVEQRGR